MTEIDKIVSIRRILIENQRISNKLMFVLASLRFLSSKKMSTNAISVFRFLRNNKRTMALGAINSLLSELVGFKLAEKHGYSYRITQLGLQELSEIDLLLKNCTYKLRSKDKPATPGLRPLSL